METNSLIVIMIGVAIILLILALTFRAERELYKADHFHMKTKYHQIKDNYDKIYVDYRQIEELYYQLQRAHLDTQSEVAFLRRKLREKATFTPAANQEEILFAVKKAMMASHPDRGGKKEDFIRINNLYNELKGGK